MISVLENPFETRKNDYFSMGRERFGIEKFVMNEGFKRILVVFALFFHIECFNSLQRSGDGIYLLYTL